MSNIDKRALRALATALDGDDWHAEGNSVYGGRYDVGDSVCYDHIASCESVNGESPLADFIASANPATVLALLDELEAAEKQIAESSKAASVSSQWKPDVCPITGRKFFMWIDHPMLGYVPTYGGPFDSYTIPTRDSDGEFSCERYDHDLGNWREGECIGLYLIDDDEQCRVYELEQRIAELEARTVTLPAQKFCPGEYMDSVLWSETEVWNQAISECAKAIRAAGIGKGE